MKQLKSKGEVLYDYANDILLFKTKNREYVHSLEFDDLVLDLDQEGFITALQIFDASKVFNLSKLALKNIRAFDMHSKVEKNIINIQLRFTSALRNKSALTHGQNFIRESFDSKLKDAEVVCSAS